MSVPSAIGGEFGGYTAPPIHPFQGKRSIFRTLSGARVALIKMPPGYNEAAR
jgi:hypothetical protein